MILGEVVGDADVEQQGKESISDEGKDNPIEKQQGKINGDKWSIACVQIEIMVIPTMAVYNALQSVKLNPCEFR